MGSPRDTQPPATPWARLTAACRKYADAEDDDDYEDASEELQRASEAWAATTVGKGKGGGNGNVSG